MWPIGCLCPHITAILRHHFHLKLILSVDLISILPLQINGGPLLTRIQEHVRFSEHEAAQIIKEIASGLDFLHKKGIAHRDLKPENILCVSTDKLCPIKICDFDLGSGINFTTELSSPSATPLLLTPVSNETSRNKWLNRDIQWKWT